MKKGLLFVFLFGIFYSGFSQGTWAMKNSIPSAGRLTAVAFSIGSKGYLGTGLLPSGYSVNDFWEYDPVNDTWTQLANFQGGQRSFAVGFSIGNKGYIGTGTDSSNLDCDDFWEYNPSANVWTKRANVPGGKRSASCSFAVNGFGYIGTGGAGPLKDLWKYDPLLNSWTQMNNFPGAARSDIDRASFVIGSKAYWGTGYPNYSDIWEYDSMTDSWTQKANFPGGGRYGATGFSACNMGYLGLGIGSGNPCSDFWMYNPITNSWSTISSFPSGARADAPAFVINNRAYVGTGVGSTYYNDLAEFTPYSCAIPVSHFNSNDSIFCAESGSCIDFFDQSTKNPTSWQWFFPGAVPDTSSQKNPTNICYSTPGTYPVTLIVSNSAGSDSLTVSPMITFATSAAAPVLAYSGDTIYCNYAAAYQWYLDGSPILNATDSFYVITGDGVYAVNITDDNGCTRLSDGFPVSVNEVSGVGGVRIYPNPAADKLWVVSDPARAGWVGGHAMLEIYDVIGELVLQSEINLASGETKSEIDISSLRKGIYFIRINGSAGAIRLVKID